MFREQGTHEPHPLPCLVTRVLLQLTFHLTGESRPRELQASRRDSVEVISLITAQLRNVFPKTPLEYVMLSCSFMQSFCPPIQHVSKINL